MKKLLVVISLLMTGCAAEVKHTWIQPSGTLPVRIINHATPKLVHDTCISLGVKDDPAQTILACALVLPDECIVHFPKNPNEHMIAHELLHCSGWKH